MSAGGGIALAGIAIGVGLWFVAHGLDSIGDAIRRLAEKR